MADSAFSIDFSVRIASLRYLSTQSVFADAINGSGITLPETLRCVVVQSPEGLVDVLLWRSPTETIIICKSSARIDSLRKMFAASNDGCLVDQSGGQRLIRLRASAADLLTHMGGGFAELEVGSVRIGRMADVAILVCRPTANEIMLLLDRLYLGHFLGYMSP